MADETSDRLRGRDALKRERAQIRYYTRRMTPRQGREFQRRVEQTKRGMGLGGGAQLSPDTLQVIREDILGTA